MTAPDARRLRETSIDGPHADAAFSRRRAVLTIAAGALAGVGIIGCTSGGRMRVASVQQPDRSLLGRFDRGFYAYTDENTVQVLLVDGSVNTPRQVVQLRMHWRPRAGRTPVDRTSTNTSVRYIIFSGGAAGMYSGAGFLFPRNMPGKDRFRAELRTTSARLVDASESFVDPLGLAEISGDFSVRRDDAAVLRLVRVVERRLEDRLGYPVLLG